MFQQISKPKAGRSRTDRKVRALRTHEKDLIELLEGAPVYSLTNAAKIKGQGVYALVYKGQFPSYAAISIANRVGERVLPIYIGKAWATKPGLAERAAAERVGRHRRSIMMLDDLNAEDFEVRFIALPWGKVESIEQALINLYAPLWNVALPGFGNKHPGKGRAGQRRSAFDTFHMGRPFAALLSESVSSLPDIIASIQEAILKWANDVVDVIAAYR